MRNMRKLILLLLLIPSLLFAQRPNNRKWFAKKRIKQGTQLVLSPPTVMKVIAGSGYGYGMIKYLPEGHAELLDKKWPVLIFMHGTGGRGTGNLADLDLLISDASPTLASEIGFDGVDQPAIGSPWRIGGSNPYRDMIVLMPQTATTMDRGPLGVFIQDIIEDPAMRVDPDNINLTGFSLGAIGIFRWMINLEVDYNRVAGDRPPTRGHYAIAGQDWQSAYKTLAVDRAWDVMTWCGDADASGGGNYLINTELVVTDMNSVTAGYATYTEIAGEGHTSAVWGDAVWKDYSSSSIYNDILTAPLKIVPSKSTGGTWPVTGFTSAVTLPGGVDLLADDIKVMLVTSSHTPSGDTFISTVDDYEVSGTGYTAGGTSLSGKTLTVNDFDANDVAWSSTTLSNVRYIYLFKNTGDPTTSPIIGYINLGRDRKTTGVDFVIQWYSTGILTKT